MRRRLITFLNSALYLALLLVVLWASFVILFGKGGVVKRRAVEKELALVEEEIRSLEEEKALTELRLANLQDNTRFIEGYARELGYKKPGEIIFKFIRRQ
jgi:cell division protein FtsB